MEKLTAPLCSHCSGSEVQAYVDNCGNGNYFCDGGKSSFPCKRKKQNVVKLTTGKKKVAWILAGVVLFAENGTFTYKQIGEKRII